MAKAIERFLSSSPRRPRCSQDGLLEPTWAPKRLPRRSKNTQKGHVFLLFFKFLVPYAPKCPQDARDSDIWSKKSPQDLPRPPLDLDFITISDDLDDFLKEFSSCFAFRCFTGSITNHAHYQNNASTRESHFRNNISYLQRTRDMIASVCRK